MDTPNLPPDGLHWEDFDPGRVLAYGPMTVTREAILGFAAQWDPQAFHLDEDAAAASVFGGLCASGWHTAAMTMRMMCDAYLLRAASQGSPGLDTLRWLKPVRPGDMLSGRMTVLARKPMGRRPAVGLVQSRWETVDQTGDTVLTMEGWGMFRRRVPGALTPSTAG